MRVDAVLATAGWATPLIGLGLTIRPVEVSIAYVALAVVSQLSLLTQRSRYRDPLPPRSRDSADVVLSAVVTAAVLALVAEAANYRVGAKELLIGAGGSAVLLLMSYEIRRRLRAFDDARRIAIIGTGSEALELATLIDDHPETGFVAVGVIGDQATAERSGVADRWLGPVSDLLEILADHDVEMPIVLANSFRREQFRLVSEVLLHAGYDVSTSSGVSRIDNGRLHTFSFIHEPVAVMESHEVKAGDSVVKRGVDVAVGSLLLLVLSPILVAIAAAIKVTDRGPVFFRQHRVGRDGTPFPMVKFRTMIPDAEAVRDELMAGNERNGPLFKLERDPRVTAVGRLLRAASIDELPQLINVVRGEMSLVGPRPALPEEVDQFDADLMERASVRPGMTGLWQVEARANPSFDAYRRLDLHYVENWGLRLDLRILLATASMITLAPLAIPLAKGIRRARRAPVAAPGGDLARRPVPVTDTPTTGSDAGLVEQAS